MPAKLRILLTADPALPVPPPLYGGIERIVAQLATELRRRGHTVGLLAREGSACSVDWFAPWKTENSGPLATVKNACALQRAVRDFRPSLVHSFARLASLTLVLRDETLPKIMSYQRTPTPRTVRLATWLGGDSIWFTGCSEHIAEKGRAIGGCWSAIANFADVAALPFSPKVSVEAPAVFLGRIERIKGAHLAIAVAKAAQKKLVLAGPHADTGDEGRYWKQEIAPQIDGDFVRYIGPVDDRAKSELLGSACALLAPVQWDEPFGIVFAEALACGTPVISCPRGALPEIVRQNVDGFLSEEIPALADALRNISKISRADSRRRAEQSFSIAVATDRYLNLYEEVCRAAS